MRLSMPPIVGHGLTGLNVPARAGRAMNPAMRIAVLVLGSVFFLGCGAPAAIAEHDAGARGDGGSAADGGSDAGIDAFEAWGPSADAGPPPPDWLAAGGSASCASRAGRVWCWGTLSTGALEAAPVEVAALAGARQLAISREHACALLGEGRVACAGGNRAGQLGVAPSVLARRDTFEPVAGVDHAVEVAVGDSFACARRDDGAVLCWGDDSLGQTGSPIPGHASGSSAPQPTPAPVQGVAGAIAISAGQYEACAVLAGGSVRCWGYDWWGALGRGPRYTGSPQAIADDVEGITDAIDVASDASFSCALRRDGSVACWGGILPGIPGYDPATDDECTVVVSQECWRAPRTLPGIADVLALSMAGGTGCVRTSSDWQCWGRDDAGQATGDGSAATPITDLAVAPGHLCVRDLAGVVSCRGRGTEGQLGDGRSTSSRGLVVAVLPSP